MPIHVHVHHHMVIGGMEEKLDALLTLVQTQGAKIMSKLEELEAELVEANAVTNEIAADLDDLLAKLAAGGLTVDEADAVKAQIVALKDRLTGVASKHTPERV